MLLRAYTAYSSVQQNTAGQITIIDKTGAVKNTINSPSGKLIDTSFSANCVRLTKNGSNFLLNVMTGARTSPQYIDVLPFSNGHAAVHAEKGGWGYIREDFSEYLSCKYTWARSFQTAFSVAPVADKNLMVGVISSRKAGMTIPFEYRDITDFNPYGYALGERGDGQCVLISVQALPVALPAGDLHSFQLYGRYVIQKNVSGYTVLDTQGNLLYPDLSIQEVFGRPDSEGIIIKSNGHLYFP